MADISIITKYFDNLTDTQKHQFEMLYDLYTDWNSKINVISRKDTENLYERHVLHSLGIAKFIEFDESDKIIDIGTGGGFPAIPLAIMFPNTQIHAIDGVRKKIKVVNEVATAIGLTNIKAEQLRAEECKGKYDYVVSRAVMQMPDLVKLSRPLLKTKSENALPSGVIALKGGNLDEEIKPFKKICEIIPLSDVFDEEFFTTKELVYVPR